jgi:hypothetical protein
MMSLMRKTHLLSLTVFTTATLLTGCVQFGQTKTGPTEEELYLKKAAEQREKINQPLVNASKAIHRELEKLNTVTLADAKPEKQTTVRQLKTKQLSKKIDLHWSGDIVRAVEGVTIQLPGWETISDGNGLTSQVWIRIDEIQTPAFEVLRKIGLQAGHNTGVTIDEKNKKVIITFLGEQ